ncbi:hypothetical protein AB838_07805 [Rhodobacteraceae bacterium (ex Bugula neritina AB1)]|nr:hypothetical protein AB838_07805 [Rhodobacteraceae bacterium (ex Bugula neritina AB1)]
MSDKELEAAAAKRLKILYLRTTEKMGVLIEKWAGDRTTRPKTMDELDAQLIANGVIARPESGQFPHWPNGRPSGNVVFLDEDHGMMSAVPAREEDFVIRIPTPATIKASKALAKTLNGSFYPLAQDYDKAYRGDPPRESFSSQRDWEEMYRIRLGDYCINKCM